LLGIAPDLTKGLADGLFSSVIWPVIWSIYSGRPPRQIAPFVYTMQFHYTEYSLYSGHLVRSRVPASATPAVCPASARLATRETSFTEPTSALVPYAHN